MQLPLMSWAAAECPGWQPGVPLGKYLSPAPVSCAELFSVRRVLKALPKHFPAANADSILYHTQLVRSSNHWGIFFFLCFSIFFKDHMLWNRYCNCLRVGHAAFVVRPYSICHLLRFRGSISIN